MKERLSRRQFLKRAGRVGLGIGLLGEAFVLSGCDEASVQEKEEEVKALLTQVAILAAQAAATPEEPETPRLTPKPTKEPSPTPRLEGFRAVEGENLVYIVEQYPSFDKKDEFYPWYRFNGGEKLFEPWAIPAGMFIRIPYPDKTPPPLPEIKTPPEKWEHKLSAHTTSLAGSSPNRMNNIRVATRKLNGTIVPPYRLFSMLETLGPFTKEEGYVMGRGYTPEGEVPMFAGGGTCQPPSALFKAAAEAGMLVIERVAHLYYIHRYGPWDATINEGGVNLGEPIDFTFRNLFDWPVQIRAEISEDEKNLIITLWSPNPLPYEKIETETLYNNVANYKVGGKAAVRQRVFFKDRIRERIYYSQYKPKPE